MNPFTDTQTAIRWIESLAAIGVALSSLEWLANARHLHDDGVLGWPIAQLRHPALCNGGGGWLLGFLFRYPVILVVLAIRLAAAVILLTGVPLGYPRAMVTAVVTITSLSIALRSPFGLDGSDQMATFIFSNLTIARLLPTALVSSAFLWVIALQSCLAYFTAGIAKLISVQWRSGVAVTGISATRIYGSGLAANLVGERGWVCVALAWSVIFTECSFPLCLTTPLQLSILMLAGGALFHVTSGVVMGLNTFIWSFVATYPAILWCHAQLHAHLR